MLVNKNHLIDFQRRVKNNSTIVFSSDIAIYFTIFWPKNADVIKNYAGKAQYLHIFGKYIVAGTSIPKNRTVALSVQKLWWGEGVVTPLIRSAYIKKPIQNRVSLSIELVVPLRYILGGMFFIPPWLYIADGVRNNAIFRSCLDNL